MEWNPGPEECKDPTPNGALKGDDGYLKKLNDEQTFDYLIQSPNLGSRQPCSSPKVEGGAGVEGQPSPPQEQSA